MSISANPPKTLRIPTQAYLDACKKLDQEPNKPYPGKLMLRIPPEVHAAVATSAQLSGKSINQWATDILQKASNAE